MVRPPSSLLALALLVGCARGQIVLDDGGSDDGATEDGGLADGGGDDGGGTEGDGGTADGGAGDGGAGDGGAGDGGAGDGGGDGGTDWSGVYLGDLVITARGDGWDYDLGTCDTTVMVEPLGPLTGVASCSTGGWGSDTYDVPINGEVTSDGQVIASALVDLGWSGTAMLDVTGWIEGDLMSVVISGVLGSGYGATDVEGEGELERQ